jgi:O-antigen/teichoic acid export membrane protein
VIVNVVGGSVSMLGQIALFPLAVASAGVQDYGVWLAVFGLVTFLSQLDGGLGTALIRNSARARATNDPSALGRLAGGTNLAYIGLAVVMALVALPLALHIASATEPSDASPAILATIGSVALAIAVVTRRAQALTMGSQRFDVERLHLLAGLLVRALGLVATYMLGWGLVGVATSEALSLAIPGVLSAVRLRTNVPDIAAEYGPGAVKEVISALPFSLTAGALAGLQTASIHLPVTLIGLVGGPGLATLYAAPQRAQQAVRQVLTWATYPLLPSWATTSGTPHHVDGATRTTNAALPFGFFAAAAVAPLVVFSQEILTVWVGPRFGPAHWLLAALALTVLIQGVHGLGLIMSLARGGGGVLLPAAAASTAATLLGVAVAARHSLTAIAITTLVVTLLTQPLFFRALLREDARDTRAATLGYVTGAALPLVAAGVAWVFTIPIELDGQRLFAGVVVYAVLLTAVTLVLQHRFGFKARLRDGDDRS